MAALINTLDNYSPTQVGENGHAEHGWSNSIQEKILQFSFQVTRTDTLGVSKLAVVLYDILTELKAKINLDLDVEVVRGYLSVLYKLIGNTRDIVDGKGEYTLSYMMIFTWYKFYPALAEFALKCFVSLEVDDEFIHPYGSWKDIKYFCEYCKSQGDNTFLIHYAICLLNKQIKQDYTNMLLKDSTSFISLAAKWAPREKSSFGWLYNDLATNYFSEFLLTANTNEQLRKAVLKCKTEYRKTLSTLNRHLDTLQVKQCRKDWSSINFNKVTSISLSKQNKAFLNIKKNGETRFNEDEDRIGCATNFKTHVETAVQGETEMKGKRVGMADFCLRARDLLCRTGYTNQTETDLLNSQWRDNASQNGGLGNMIAMVDVSGSMEGDPMNVAISLGIRIAEKSVLGKRIMTFSAKPTWVNLEPYPDFVSQVGAVVRADWGMNTNFYAALDMILDAIITNKMPAEDVQDMVLVILSDMQIDQGDKSFKTSSLYETMKTKYLNAGIRVHGNPYKPPHILFWNLRSTSGFPSLANQSNASMMSGFSPALLNVFCEQGINALQSATPWSMLEKSLDNERYAILGDKLDSFFV
jgi:hypothetical protein